MNNRIIFEFNEDDRARLDKLTVLLSRLVDLLPQHISVSTPTTAGKPDAEQEAIQKKLAEVVANAKTTEEATETPQEATEGETLTETPPTEEKPTTASPDPAVEPVTAVTLQLKVIELIRAKKKPQVLEVLNSIGVQTVSAVPEDKVAEVYAKLTALEG